MKNKKYLITCRNCQKEFNSSYKNACLCSYNCILEDKRRLNAEKRKNQNNDLYIKNAIQRVSKTPVDIDYIKSLRRNSKNCFYCGIELNYSNFSIDHKTPAIKGGTNENSNLVACCLYCNSRKKNKTAEEYKRELEKYGIIDHWI